MSVKFPVFFMHFSKPYLQNEKNRKYSKIPLKSNNLPTNFRKCDKPMLASCPKLHLNLLRLPAIALFHSWLEITS